MCPRDIGFDGELSKRGAALEAVCNGILDLLMPCEGPLGPVATCFMVCELVWEPTVVAMSRTAWEECAQVQGTGHLEIGQSERVVEGNDAHPSSAKVAGGFRDQEALLGCALCHQGSMPRLKLVLTSLPLGSKWACVLWLRVVLGGLDGWDMV